LAASEYEVAAGAGVAAAQRKLRELGS
jgi:hypothetical protein